MPVEAIKPGMRATALTVFEGVKPEPVEVEILGVLRNLTGPRSHLILARLRGAKAEHNGVVAGMSGSPVYIDGKLIGALAYRIGAFAKEPIAGITPIADMLEINELDTSTSSPAAASGPPRAEAGATSLPANLPELPSFNAPGYGMLTPIGAPLAFSGFSEETLQRFGAQFAAAGVIPVLGAGAADPDIKQAEPLEAGSSVAAVLVRGDMNIAATCTVTYVDPERLLACGHPLLQFGHVDLPMTKSHVNATLASTFNSFKIATSTESVGAFVQDRRTGILGKFGRGSEMVPVALEIHGGPQPKRFSFEVLNNPRLTPIAIMSTVFNALQGVNEHGEDVTYRMRGSIRVAGFPDVALQNMYAPADGLPTSFLIALALGERFGRIYENPYQKPRIEGVDLSFDLVRERRSARLETARTDVTEARPGDDIVIEAVLRPYRGERIVRQIPVRIPPSTPKGTLRILVSDAETMERTRRATPALLRKLDLSSTIALLNKERVNSRLYVSLLETNPQAMVEDKVMPALPLSVMNIMDAMRGTQDMIVVGESAVNESSTPLDYVVSGAQMLTVTIK